MVKKKGPVWNFFNLKGKGVSCKYCFKEYKQSHSNKMENHIKKCFKCPQDLKKVLELSTMIEKPIKKKSPYEPLIVEVEDFNKPGPSSGSFKSSSSSEFLPQPVSSSTPKGIPSFVDHMDIQTNVSKHLKNTQTLLDLLQMLAIGFREN